MNLPPPRPGFPAGVRFTNLDAPRPAEFIALLLRIRDGLAKLDRPERVSAIYRSTWAHCTR